MYSDANALAEPVPVKVPVLALSAGSIHHIEDSVPLVISMCVELPGSTARQQAGLDACALRLDPGS
jgi:hypothetical protein